MRNVELSVVRKFWRDRRGNFAMFTGLTAILLLGGLGGAVDISVQSQSNSRLQVAVDAAALAAARKLEEDIDADTDGEIRTIAFANLPPALKNAELTAQVDKEARTVRVEMRGTIQPSFLPLLRINELVVGAKAVSSVTRRHYSDFYIMLDVSESMNLAASDEDRKKLETLTARWMRLKKDGGWGKRLEWDGQPRTCAFACHWVEDYWSDLSVFEMNEREGVINLKNKARLRIDVVRDATRTMIGRVLDENSKPGSIWRTRVGTAFFSESFTWGTVPSNNAANVIATLGKSSIPSRHTHYRNAFDELNRGLGVQGTGKTEDAAEKVVIVITDGVSDTNRWELGTLDARFCQDIKDKRIKLAILEIKYLKIEDKYGFFRDRVGSFYPRISTDLKSCASDSLYYQATDADQAASKLIDMTKMLLPPANHLSQ